MSDPLQIIYEQAVVEISYEDNGPKIQFLIPSSATDSSEAISQHNLDPEAHPHLLDLIENIETGGNIDGGTFN